MSKLNPFRNLDALFQTAEICLPVPEVHGSEMDPSGQGRSFSSNTGIAVMDFSSFSEILTTAVGTTGSCKRQLELCTILFLIPPCAGPSSYLEREQLTCLERD